VADFDETGTRVVIRPTRLVAGSRPPGQPLRGRFTPPTQAGQR